MNPKTRTLGRTQLEVSQIGFGTAPLGDLYARLDDELAIQAAAAALDDGVTLFDTSPHYGNGLAEHRLGTALRRVPRDSVVISTKVGRVMSPGQRSTASSPNPDVASPGFAGGFPHSAQFDYSYDGTLRSLEQSLLRLGLDRVDILLIHDADVWTHGSGFEARFQEAMEGSYRALSDLRKQGVVKAIGVGVNEVDTCARFLRAGDFDCVMLAGRYSLLEQLALDDFFGLAAQKGIGVLLGGVFNSGILATGPTTGCTYNYKPAPAEIIERVRRIDEVCRRHGVRLADAAVRFPLAHPNVASVVLGATTPAEVARNSESVSQPIPAALWSDLRAAGLLRADAPTPA
jgi:D-threo-aldose 1-dehydrogenase